MARRDYQNNYPSVTQCLNVLAKPALLNWYKWNSAKFCDEESRKGKEIGTLIHTAIQDHIELREVKVETEYGSEVMNALKSFMLFKEENPKIKLKRAEMALTSEKYKFNGTMDAEAEEDSKTVVLDWKSSKAKGKELVCYDEYLWQTSAYGKLWEEVYKAKIETAYILILAKDDIQYLLRKLNKEEINGYFENVFLPCLKIYNHQKRR